MIFKERFTLIALCAFVFMGYSQEPKFGKVSKEELSEKAYPKDESANAAYLYKNRRTHFEYNQQEGFLMVTDIHERIKIYNKDGFDYATKKVNLYKDGSANEKLTSLKAMTFNLVNGKIEESKLKKEGEFKTELSKYIDQKSFTMPNIKEGSVIDYKYKITSPFISNVDEYVFQHDIPIKKIDAVFEAPEYFNYRVNTKGFLNVIPISDRSNGKISLTSKTRSGGGFSPKRTSFDSQDITFYKNITKYDISDVPALKDESFVNNINNYRSAVKYELSYTKFPNSIMKHYTTTWEDVVKKIYKSPNFGAELDKNGYYNDAIDALIAKESDAIKRASLIFNFVKSKVKWNGNYG